MLWPSGCVTPWPFCTRFSCSSFYFSARRVRPSLLEFRVSGPGSYRVSRPPQCGGTPLRHAPNLLSCSIGKSAISNPSLTCDGCQGRRKFSHKGTAFSIVRASILPHAYKAPRSLAILLRRLLPLAVVGHEGFEVIAVNDHVFPESSPMEDS